MTKKFWKNWQNRVGETELIVIKTEYCLKRIFSKKERDTLKDISFNEDSVTLVIERHRILMTHHHKENETLTLQRTEIHSVKFK